MGDAPRLLYAAAGAMAGLAWMTMDWFVRDIGRALGACGRCAQENGLILLGFGATALLVTTWVAAATAALGYWASARRERGL